MAKFRKIHTSFWDDPLIEQLSPDTRYFYLFLMTNPACTECGIYQITIKKMCDYTGYNSDAIKVLIRTLEVEHSRIVYDTSTYEICIVNKPNYIDRLGKPVIDCLHSELRKVKNKSLIIKQLKNIERQEVRIVYDTYTIGVQEEEKEEEKEEELNNNKKNGSQFPKAENFNGLSDMQTGQVIEYVKATKGVALDTMQVETMWGVFKTKHLTGQNFYKDDHSVYSHFLDSLKYQQFNTKSKYTTNATNKQNPFIPGRDNPNGEQF